MTGRILWIVSLLLAFTGGFESGSAGRESPISRILNAPRCVSGKQFLVAFTEEPGYSWSLRSERGGDWTTDSKSIAVDGLPVGHLGYAANLPRTYVCEGVHQAAIKVSRKNPDLEEQYRINFVVSRASLFRALQYEADSPENCISPKRCSHDASLRLSSLDPDGPEVRAALKE